MAILQLNPTIWLKTPKGVGLCHFVIDYGEEHDLMWVVADDATGEIWTWPNPKVRAIPNISIDAERKNALQSKLENYENALLTLTGPEFGFRAQALGAADV
jgi:hypothetical protein